MLQIRYLSDVQFKHNTINEAKNNRKPTTDSGKTESTDKADGTTTDNKDLTIEEYEKKIQDTISKYTVHDSQSKTTTAFNITDAALKLMKKDPEFEKKILEKIKVELNTSYPKGSEPTYRVIRVGDKIEDFQAQTMEASHKDLFESNTKDSLWIKKPDEKKTDSSKQTSERSAVPKTKSTPISDEERQTYFEQLEYDKQLSQLKSQQYRKK